MDNRIKVSNSELDDINELSQYLRPEDEQECEASGSDGYLSLLNGFILSKECYTARLNDEIILGMFGIAQTPEGINAIWFLGSDYITKVPIAFISQGRKYVKEWLNKYGELYCCADERNTTHIKYIKAIGFNLIKETLINNNKFLLFNKRG